MQAMYLGSHDATQGLSRGWKHPPGMNYKVFVSFLRNAASCCRHSGKLVRPRPMRKWPALVLGAWSYTVAGCGTAGQQGDREWTTCRG